uniref:Uncharacterized protein n=1 Tax=Alexandrium monilatum TaxID=311494 RepID=A0A7S4RB77_9DINO
MSARLAVARLLRARAVDASEALRGLRPGDVHVLPASHATDTARLTALLEAAASPPPTRPAAGGAGDVEAERLVLLPRSAAERLLANGALSAPAAPALSGQAAPAALAAGSAPAQPERLPASGAVDASAAPALSGQAAPAAPAAGSAPAQPEGAPGGPAGQGCAGGCPDEAGDALLPHAAGGELATLDVALPTVPLRQVAVLLGQGMAQRTLARTPPASVTRGRTPLTASAQRLFQAVEACSPEDLERAIAASEEGDLDRPHPLHGGSCLHVAAGCLEPSAAARMVEQLCARGAAVDARAANASTPLHWAAGAGNTQAVSELLRWGADAGLSSYTWRSNVFGKGSGQTPAHWAAESGHQECVEALVEGSALAPFVEDERGQLPMDLAVKEGHDEVAAALEAAAESEMVCLAVSTEAAVHMPLPASPSWPRSAAELP